MKFYFLLFCAPLAFISCAKNGSGLLDPANDVPPAKKVTKTTPVNQKNATSNYTHDLIAPQDPTSEQLASTNRGEDFKKYAAKHSRYGTLKDAAAPPSKEELAAEPDPINMPQKNIITPPTGG